MKDCREYEARISALLDGELSGPEQTELMEHMAACPSCQQYFDDLAAIHEAIAALEEIPVPEGFTRLVMDRVRATRQDKAAIRFPHWRRWAALAACCAFALFGAWHFRSTNSADLAASQEMAVAGDISDGPADIPESGDSGGMTAVTAGEQYAGGMSRMADSVSSGGSYEEEDMVEANAGLPESSMTVMEASAPSPAAPANAPARDSAGGTLTAGGGLVRQWVAHELGQDWQAGQVYALTEEQYVRLVDFLTEAGVEFQVEAGDACLLIAE